MDPNLPLPQPPAEWHPTWNRNTRGSIALRGSDPNYYSSNNHTTYHPYEVPWGDGEDDLDTSVYELTTEEVLAPAVKRQYRNHPLTSIREEGTGVSHPRVGHLATNQYPSGRAITSGDHNLLPADIRNLIEAWFPPEPRRFHRKDEILRTAKRHEGRNIATEAGRIDNNEWQHREGNGLQPRDVDEFILLQKNVLRTYTTPGSFERYKDLHERIMADPLARIYLNNKSTNP